MRERLRNFERVYEFFLLTQKRIERFNESRFKSRKVKGRATSSENRKFFVAVMEGTLGVVKKMLTNSGFVKLLWAYVVFARAGKTLAVGRGTRIGDGFRRVVVVNEVQENTFLNPSPILVPRPTAKVQKQHTPTTISRIRYQHLLTTPNVPSITATKNFLMLFSLK